MNLSLNELDTLAKRAARGAGYSWGLAEEAGKATRWLCSQGLDGIGELSRLLEYEMSVAPSMHRPEQSADVWHAAEGLCPLATGTYLCDLAKVLGGRAQIIRDIVSPTLLLPFVAKVAIQNRQHYSIECDDVLAVIDGNMIAIDTAFPNTAHIVAVRTGGSMSNCRQQQCRVSVEVDHLTILNRYARKTYAPESDQSRMLGAGAGLSDND